MKRFAALGWALPMILHFTGLPVLAAGTRQPAKAVFSQTEPVVTNPNNVRRGVSIDLVAPKHRPDALVRLSDRGTTVSPQEGGWGPDATVISQTKQLNRDYALAAPLPELGRTTVVSVLDRLDRSLMFAPCPGNSKLFEFAESTNLLVQICIDDTKNNGPVYWMGYGKDGRGSLTVKSNENFEFWNGGTYYSLERRGKGENSYIIIGNSDGNLRAEAILYYYYPCLGEEECLEW
ncbi:MAG TPA: hypothetical protein IGS52_13080 [Oscillatoriaceae cyanobacterium M33_DOE_052]|uniref:Uncharacterized protein n=1 Tax=Planktothricoides sp. SpSt-374 TaxID=2282167 RepID=A0A7C3ZKY3_9CYAN|nr:hypothetical protein [Oscillatoriaceae cyanobacterium M33_DOE_052]